MRCTQFIGMTNAAQQFVSNMKGLPSSRGTFGLFNEEIPLASFKDASGDIWHEIFQLERCSPELMIFTCLENERTKERRFQWKEDSYLPFGEYDLELGLLWI